MYVYLHVGSMPRCVNLFSVRLGRSILILIFRVVFVGYN